MSQASSSEGRFARSPHHRAPGSFTRFLWFCAGADGQLLSRCPLSDWVKYQGIGGIVLATTVLAFVSASYAFYTVFSPKTTTALQASLDPSTAIFACVAGLIWALVIFNIDRFIVSSTGKGDGTEKITLEELFQSLPRLLMAGIVGVCISAPLEIRILKPEIDAQLELEQNKYLSELNGHAEKLVQARREELLAKLDKAQRYLEERGQYFEKRRLEIKDQRHQLELEAEGKTGSGVAGRGPAWQDKKDTLDKLEAELQQDKASDAEKGKVFESEIESSKRAMASLSRELEEAKASNLRQSRHLDGLMKRIHISHEIGGMVPWAILLLLLAVETGPIFFKMMMVRSSYDYLLENEKQVATAALGVELDAQVFVTEANEEIRVDTFHGVQATLAEEKRRLETEAKLSALVHERFLEHARADVNQGDNYKKYLQED
jgi:hypothetical protein